MTEETPRRASRPATTGAPEVSRSTVVTVWAVILEAGRLLGVRRTTPAATLLPGGRVLPGEPLVQALHRLIHVELGLRPTAAEPIGSIETSGASGSGCAGEGGLEILQIFEVSLAGTSPVEQGRAGEGPIWIPLDRLAAEPLRPAVLGPALTHWLDTGRPFLSVLQVPGHAGGEPEGPFALRPYIRYPRQTTVRHSARALLLDGDDLILFRRTVPGREVYWTTPGGRTEPQDADLEATLRRELAEELGATIGPAVQVYTVWQQGGGVARIQHFFACRLEEMNLSLRDGPEFDDPGAGLHEVERVPFTPAGVRSIKLYPEELVDYLANNIAVVRRLL